MNTTPHRVDNLLANTVDRSVVKFIPFKYHFRGQNVSIRVELENKPGNEFSPVIRWRQYHFVFHPLSVTFQQLANFDTILTFRGRFRWKFLAPGIFPVPVEFIYENGTIRDKSSRVNVRAVRIARR